jgi:hypothetical protein
MENRASSPGPTHERARRPSLNLIASPFLENNGDGTDHHGKTD